MKHPEQRVEQRRDLWRKPMLSRYSREPLPSQMPTPFCFSTPALVLPLMNQSNSSATPAHQTPPLHKYLMLEVNCSCSQDADVLNNLGLHYNVYTQHRHQNVSARVGLLPRQNVRLVVRRGKVWRRLKRMERPN